MRPTRAALRRAGQRPRDLYCDACGTRVEYEIRDAGDSVVVLLDQRMRGRSTGIEVDFGKHAQVWDFRDGLIKRWKFHASQQEASKPWACRSRPLARYCADHVPGELGDRAGVR